MARYEFDPSVVQSGFEVFPKGEYELQVGQPKAFERTNNKTGKTSFGVRFPLTVGSGDYKGKRAMFTYYLHTEGGQQMGKRFLMAALGYDRKQEDEFNKAMAGADWAYDTDSGAVGDAWRKATGARVLGTADVQQNTETDEEQQNWKSFRPYTG